MKFKTFLFATILALLTTTTSYAQLDWLKKNVKAITENPIEVAKQTSLSETEIGQGLKEALKVGISNTVEALSKTGGYSANEKIKIPIPEKIKFLDKTLRTIGMGDKIDDFVLSMNKAAESAAPAAQEIFLDALFDMNIDDAQKLFQAGNTAATDYFKEKTYDKLNMAFKPTIDKTLAQYDVTDKYNSIIDKYKTIPFSKKINLLSPDDYVITKALDGLFFMLGEKEKEIRENPAARVTDILKRVFK